MGVMRGNKLETSRPGQMGPTHAAHSRSYVLAFLSFADTPVRAHQAHWTAVHHGCTVLVHAPLAGPTSGPPPPVLASSGQEPSCCRRVRVGRRLVVIAGSAVAAASLGPRTRTAKQARRITGAGRSPDPIQQEPDGPSFTAIVSKSGQAATRAAVACCNTRCPVGPSPLAPKHDEPEPGPNRFPVVMSGVLLRLRFKIIATKTILSSSSCVCSRPHSPCAVVLLPWMMHKHKDHSFLKLLVALTSSDRSKLCTAHFCWSKHPTSSTIANTIRGGSMALLWCHVTPTDFSNLY